MEPFKLRIKIGEHEFEAEGEQGAVERQFEAWRSIVLELPSSPPPPAVSDARKPSDEPEPEAKSAKGEWSGFSDFGKVFRHEDNLVSLSVLPRGPEAEQHAALLVLLGRRYYLNEDLVGGTWVKRGLEQSGLLIERPDRILGELESYVTRVGRHRAVRYRLTNIGLSKAQELAQELAKMVA